MQAGPAPSVLLKTQVPSGCNSSDSGQSPWLAMIRASVGLRLAQLPSDNGTWPCGQQVPAFVAASPCGQQVCCDKQICSIGQEPDGPGGLPLKHTQVPLGPGISDAVHACCGGGVLADRQVLLACAVVPLGQHVPDGVT